MVSEPSLGRRSRRATKRKKKKKEIKKRQTLTLKEKRTFLPVWWCLQLPPVAVKVGPRQEKGGVVDRLKAMRVPLGARVRRQEAKAAAVKMPHHAGRGLLLPPRKREEARGEEKGWRHSSPSLAGGQARQLTHTKASPAAAATVSEKRREREKQLGF